MHSVREKAQAQAWYKHHQPPSSSGESQHNKKECSCVRPRNVEVCFTLAFTDLLVLSRCLLV